MTDTKKISRSRTVAKWLARIAASLIAVILLVLLYILSGPGTTRTVRYALSNFVPIENARLEFESVRGNPLSSLVFSNIRLIHTNGDTLLTAESVDIGYKARSFTSNTIKFGEIRLVAPYFHTRQDSLGQWDITSIISSDSTGEPPDVNIDGIKVVNGAAKASFYHAIKDSSVTASELAFDLDSLRFGSQFAIDAKLVSGLFRAPMVDSDARLFGRAKVVESFVTVDTLSLSSDRTNLTAGGILDFSKGLFPDEGSDFRMIARPVHFSDISPFVSGIDPDVFGDVELDMSASATDAVALVSGSFSDGSSINARAARGLLPDSSYRYIFSGNASDLLLSSFETSLSVRPLTVKFDGDLSGTGPASLSGESSVELQSPTTIAGIDIQTFAAAAEITDGKFAINGASHTSVGSIVVNGNMRPFDHIPSYDLSADLEAISLDTTIPEARLHSLNGIIRISGAGYDPDSLSAIIDGQITSGRAGNVSINPGEFGVTIERGIARADASLSSSRGTLDLTGSYALASTPSFEVEELTVADLDFAAFMGDTTRTSVSGRLSANGSTNENREWTVTGTATLEELLYDTFEATDTEGAFSLTDDIAEVHVTSIMDSAFFDVDVTANLNSQGPTLRSADATFRGLDIDGFFPAAALSTSLNGTIHVEPLGLATLSWTGKLDSSVVNSASVYSFGSEGTYSSETVSFKLDASTSGGQLNGSGSVSLKNTSMVVRDVSFTDVDLSAFAGEAAPPTQLSGTADILWVGDLQSPERVDVNALLEPSVYNDVPIRSSQLAIDIRDRLGPITFNLELEDGEAEIDGTVNLAGENPAYDLTGKISRLPVARLIREDTLASSLNLDFNVNGSGITSETFELDFTVEADTSRYGSTIVSLLNASGSVREGIVETDVLELESNAIDVSASGTVGVYSDGVPSDFEIVGTLKDARPLNDFLGNDFDLIGRGIFYLAVTGPRGSETIQIDADLESVVYGDFRAGRMTTQVLAGVDDSLSFTAFDGSLAIEHFSVPSLTVRRTDFVTELRNDSLLFDVYSTIDSRRNMTIKGSTDVNDNERILLVEDIKLEFDNDAWELLQPTTIAYQDYYEVRNLLIYTESQQIALDGILDLDGEQSLLLTVENFRAGSVADLFGFQGLDGTVNGYLDLTGPADAPVIQGDLITTVESFGENYGEMNLIVSYDSLKLNLNGVVTNNEGGQLSLNGFIPVNLTLAPSSGQTETGVRVAAGQAQLNTESDMNVTAEDFALDWILPFLDPAVYSDIGGKVTGAVTITGTVSDPVLDGSATLSDGKLGLTYFGLVYDRMEGEITFDDSVINLDHVQVHSGNGELIALGTVNMSQLNLGEFDITLSAEDFLAVDNSQYRGSVVADLELTGTTTEPYITGNTTVVAGEMFMTEEIQEFDPVVLTEEDLLEVERVFGIRISEADTSTFDFVTALALDINIELERNTWFRSNSVPAMDIQLTGNLDMQKEPGDDLQIFGNIEVIPERSRITQLGKRFRIESGTLTFNGPAADPVIDLEAHYTVPNDDVTIILQVKGHLDNLEETPLDSDPPMDLTDILSYLAFGRPARESLQLSGAGSETLARDIALGQATGYLEGLAGAELGFDVFEIQQSGTETRLTAGKYLTQRLFVSVSQPISFSESTELSDSMVREITAEFELIQHLLFKLTQRESLSFDLLWEYSY